jgi:hypothetical protein
MIGNDLLPLFFHRPVREKVFQEQFRRASPHRHRMLSSSVPSWRKQPSRAKILSLRIEDPTIAAIIYYSPLPPDLGPPLAGKRDDC